MNNTEHEFILPYQNEGNVDLPAYYAYITLNFMNISSGCGSARLERLPWAQEAGGSNPLTPTRSLF